MVTARRGTSRVGCLFTILVLVSIVYFGANIAEVYFRFYRLQDRMGQEARFADSRDDPTIRARLEAAADSLGVPEDRERIRVERAANRITIYTRYTERVELPLFVREFRFAPRVERSW